MNRVNGIFLILMALTCVSYGQHHIDPTPVDPLTLEELTYYISAGRGFWTGLTTGIYGKKTSIVSDLCLNSDISS